MQNRLIAKPDKPSLLLSDADTQQRLTYIRSLTNEEYSAEVLEPVSYSRRMLPEALIKAMADKVLSFEQRGPLVLARLELAGRPLAVVAQSRSAMQGAFQAQHHRELEVFVKAAAADGLAIVSIIDTPGADASDQANRALQAHSISSLIACYTELNVATLGIIWGIGYSGGAIPMAAANELYIVKDGLFNTIQPQGLAAIARRQKMDWQSCARLIGLSPSELAADGVVDGVLDCPVNQMEIADIQVLSEFIVLRLDTLERNAEQYAEQHAIDQGAAIRELRWQHLRRRLSYQVDSPLTLPAVRREPSVSIKTYDADPIESFGLWIQQHYPLNYELELKTPWQQFRETGEREPFASLLAICLYHKWQGQFSEHVNTLRHYWCKEKAVDIEECIGLEQVILLPQLRSPLDRALAQLQVLESLYQVLIEQTPRIAEEYSRSEDKSLSRATVESVLSQALAAVEGAQEPLFADWLVYLDGQKLLTPMIEVASRWKQRECPSMDQIQLIGIGFFITTLLPRYFASQAGHTDFDGGFAPRRIGRTKNFWHRLTQTSRNARIQSLLSRQRESLHIDSDWITREWAADFRPLFENLMTANARQFPGFADSIAQCQQAGGQAVGLVAGEASLTVAGEQQTIAVFASNNRFQAGAFDMASAEKLCRLLAWAADRKQYVLGFIASGGMQTKEGPAALFSMPVVNEAINRFCEQWPGRLMIVGHGDCTGGAQASLVTHPKVVTGYFSAANAPFAGQVVVPEHLSLQGRLSNYLAGIEGGADLLIRHPLCPELDAQLAAIDPAIIQAGLSLDEAVKGWLAGQFSTSESAQTVRTNVRATGPLSRVLIHARGCTAARLLDAAQAYAKPVVLVQSDPDMHTALAGRLSEKDRLVCLGGATPDESYLNAESVLRVAELYAADAIHPGIGFLSENPEFAYACEQRGIQFIGPSAGAIALMGDKAAAIRTAAEIGLPVVPGSNGALESEQHALTVAADIGYPVLLKASFGGGGKGIAIADTPEELSEHFQRLKREAQNAFGNSELYLESCLRQVRHVEVQILRDTHGHARALGVRDCSVQRARQKVVEESGEYVLSPEQRARLEQWSIVLADHIDYVGAGTVEFLYDLERQCFYFMEMNTRLQVEHPVTEMTTGIDIVRQQFVIAEGLPMELDVSSEVIESTGHALEVRINAEQVSSTEEGLSVQPSTGLLTRFDVPDYPWARVLGFLEEGCEVSPFYDSLIAQIIVKGETRAQAIERMQQLLDELCIEGVTTNVPLLKHILTDQVFAQGQYSTAYLDELLARRPLDVGQQSGKTDTQDSGLCERHGQELYLLAPSSGVIYCSPSPGEADFIQQGQQLKADDTLFLLEAMKVFAPLRFGQFMKDQKQTYRISHIRVQDGEYVQSGDVLMILREEETSQESSMSNDTQAKVFEIVAEQLGLEVAEVKEDSHFIDDLGADSLSVVELVMAFEEAFNVEISDDEAEKLQTVADVLAMVSANA